MRKPLSSLAAIRAGYTMRHVAGDAATETYRMIHIRNVGADGELDISGLATMQLPRWDERFFVRPGDVLFSARGTKNVAAIGRALPDRTLVGTQFFILTPDPARLLPEFLQWFINSPTGQIQLAALSKGSFVAMITAADLRDLPVPCPPLDVQRAVVELDQLVREEKRLLLELMAKRAALAAALGRRLTQDD